MNLPRIRLRFTVRTLMIAVAFVGACVWIAQMRSRSAAYRERAYAFVSWRGRFGKIGISKYGKSFMRGDDEDYYNMVAWKLDMAEKYWRLADRPWSTVGPDPQPPKPLAHPRPGVDCPPELASVVEKCPRWFPEPVYPWWTLPWTWGGPRPAGLEPRWSFP